MKIILIGASGTIGSAIYDKIGDEHEVVRVGRSSGDRHADLSDPDSVCDLLKETAPFDAVVSAAGNAAFKPLGDLDDEDFELSVSSKLMGQVNLVRYGHSLIRPSETSSFTLVSGVLSTNPMPGSAAVSMVNAGLEGFVRAAALDLPAGVRINAVSPPWVSETLEAMGQDPSGGQPASSVADAFLASVHGSMTGEVIDARDYEE